MKAELYDDTFYEGHVEGALRSARVIVPIVMKLATPASVVDVGCGRGAWLRVFQENGAKVVLGIDGSYVDSSKLLIDAARFTAADLSKPIKIEGEFDLAVCLEVAEHLPTQSGPKLVRSLTAVAPVVMFSAAIPGQGGDGHLNERWPAYWAELFSKRDFEMIDAIRPQVREDLRVEPWYRQNILLFASKTALASRLPALAAAASTHAPEIEWVHISTVRNYRKPRALLRIVLRALGDRLRGKRDE
jgi:SAM-dependent methyltransferase